jgi:SnoaL-like domain
VRANWSALLEGIPDFHAEILRSAVDGDTIFVEIHWTGAKADGTPLEERGVVIMGIREDRIAWGVSTPTKSNAGAPTSTPLSAEWRVPKTVSADAAGFRDCPFSTKAGVSGASLRRAPRQRHARGRSLSGLERRTLQTTP